MSDPLSYLKRVELYLYNICQNCIMYILWLWQIGYNFFLVSKWNQSAPWFWMNNFNNSLSEKSVELISFSFWSTSIKDACINLCKRCALQWKENQFFIFQLVTYSQNRASNICCWNGALGFGGPHIPNLRNLLHPDPEDPWQYCHRSGRIFFVLVSSLWLD